MQRCPECYEIYTGSEKFCELDGRPLLEDLAIPAGVAAAKSTKNEPGDSWGIWAIAALSAMGGVMVATLGFAIHSLSSDSPERQEQVQLRPNARDASPPRTTSLPASNSQPQQSLVAPTASPAPGPSQQTQETAAPDTTQTVAARLDQGPVTTGEGNKGQNSANSVQTFIQMNDGSELKVDAAWRDGQGVWYRRGGLVSFVDSSRVKAIVARTEQDSSN